MINLSFNRNYKHVTGIRLFLTVISFSVGLFHAVQAQDRNKFQLLAVEVLRPQVLRDGAWALKQEPITVTAASSARSAGGKHDFYSEGDYWWPDPANPEGPYIQKDGLTNPDNFTGHRKAMIRFSRIVGALASAYILTHDKKYALHAMQHCKAWFIDVNTLMNPNLLFAQAIKGRATGRGIGIIDTIHFLEVVQALMVFENYRVIDPAGLIAIKGWFTDYLKWLTTHPYGKDEMNASNNHGTCWVMQVAAFATFTGNQELINFCTERYKTVLLPRQMAEDGSFPLELKRTKPYGYSIFNLDAMTMICQILTTSKDNLWLYKAPSGQTIKKGIDYLFPFIKEKSSWPFGPDVMYWNDWPVAQPFLLFGAMRFNKPEWFNTWKNLDHSPVNEEVIRNLPVRNPLIWIMNAQSSPKPPRKKQSPAIRAGI